MKFLLLILLLAASASAESVSPATLSDLRCEGLSNPEKVRTATPRLSWQLSGPGRGVHQTAVRILAASTVEKLAASEGDLWDSGELATSRSQLIPFGGEALKDGQRVHWKVQIKDKNKAMSAWSTPAQFQVALTAKAPESLPLYLAEAPRISVFECSDPALTKLYAEAAAALPKITTLRDIQLSLRGAGYHQNLFPRAKDWLALLNNSVDEKNRYPATLPPNGTFGSTQSDAGILAAHALWTISGDRTLLSEHWKTMSAYIQARKKHDPAFAGRVFGELPKDSLPPNDPTPVGAVHLASHGLSLRIMSELSRTAATTPFETPLLQGAFQSLHESYRKKHLTPEKTLKYNSIAGQLITLRYGLLSTPEEKKAVSQQFTKLFNAKKDVPPFSHGPLASAALLPVLTWTDNHDRAVAIAKAQTADQLTPTALVNISEWLIWMIAGLDSGGLGFQNTRFAPYIPKKETLSFAKAHLDTPFGRHSSHWHYEDDGLAYDISLPGNTTGIVKIPATEKQLITESGKPIEVGHGILRIVRQPDYAEIAVLSGSYQFKIAK